MSKYIDAEKLKAEIEKRQEYLDDHNFHSMASEYDWLLGVVESLQQEPRFPKYDNIVDKVFGAGNLEGFEYREAEMLVALAKEELLKSLQQEQPEVDLEKEAVSFCFDNGINISPRQAKNIASHFAEWGAIHLNARKEE